jgi:hypothetical protein
MRLCIERIPPPCHDGTVKFTLPLIEISPDKPMGRRPTISLP